MTNVCQEVHTQVQLAQRVINHPSVIAAAPAVPVLQPAGLLAPATAVGPLVGALGLNPTHIAHQIVKREADAEAEADAQFIFNGLTGVAGLTALDKAGLDWPGLTGMTGLTGLTGLERTDWTGPD